MTGKDFILSLDRDTLFLRYYNDYYNDEKTSESMNHSLCAVRLKENFNILLSEIEQIIPIVNSKYYLFPLLCYDCDVNDDLSYEINTIVDISLLPKDSIVRGKKKPHIKDIKEVPDSLIFETYSLMFVKWEELLGYSLAYIPDDDFSKYGIAAAFLYELSWFGYDQETVNMNMAIEEAKLNEAVEESKHPENLETLNTEDLYSYFDLEKPTEEFLNFQKKIFYETCVKNYNQKVDIYNKYFAEE